MLVNLGVAHKKAPLKLLDLLTLRDAAGFYSILRSIPGTKGTLILQTCNRVEFYFDCFEAEKLLEGCLRHWAVETGFELGRLKEIAERRIGEVHVVRHLVRLCTGLESMMVGESQITGQVRQALSVGRSLGATNQYLAEAFERSISAGGRIRQKTRIEIGAISVGSAAVRLASEVLGSLDKKRILLIGTGQAGMLVMKALKARGLTNLSVTGRDRQRTESFCRQYGGIAADIGDLQGLISKVDLVVAATSSTEYVVTKTLVGPGTTGNRRLVLLDLSNPRNVSPEVEGLSNVVVRTIDDLRKIADAALVMRKRAAEDARLLAEEEAEDIINALLGEGAENKDRGFASDDEVFRRAVCQ